MIIFPDKNNWHPKRNKYNREQFDPNATFVALRTIVTQSKHFNPGDEFDKKLVNVRRLRQLYEQRWLDMVDTPAPTLDTAKSKIPVKPDFLHISNEGLRVWLRNHGITPSPKTMRDKLIEMAEQKWKEYIDGLAASGQDSEYSGEGVPGQTDEGDSSQRTRQQRKRIRRSRT